MAEVVEHSFRTKTGTCTITPERITLTREGARGVVAKGVFGNSIARALMIYGSLGIAALAFGAWKLVNGEAAAGAFPCLIGVFFLWNVVASRNNSAAPVIERSAVRTVEAHPPRPPAMRGYFTVMFEDNGKVRKRLVMLPGSMSGGREEYEKGESAMRASGLL